MTPMSCQRRQAEKLTFLTCARKFPPMDVLKENVERRRDELGMTNAQVAIAAGVTERTVYRIIEGGYDPKLSTVAKVARGLGVPTGYLLVGRLDEGSVNDIARVALAAGKVASRK